MRTLLQYLTLIGVLGIVFVTTGAANVQQAAPQKLPALESQEDVDNLKVLATDAEKGIALINASERETRTHCLRAFGATDFCQCLSDNLPEKVSLATYIGIVVPTKEELGYARMNTEQKSLVDRVVATRELCVANLGGMLGGVEDHLGDQPLYAGFGGVSNPELIPSSKILPRYPELARRAKVQGQVILQAVVRKDGTVGDIQVLKTPGSKLGFDEAAVEAVKQWRFKPAMQNGKPVDTYFTIAVDVKAEDH